MSRKKKADKPNKKGDKKDADAEPSPNIKVLGYEEGENGEFEIEVEIDDEYVEYYKRKTGKDDIDMDEFGEFMREQINSAIGDTPMHKLKKSENESDEAK